MNTQNPQITLVPDGPRLLEICCMVGASVGLATAILGMATHDQSLSAFADGLMLPWLFWLAISCGRLLIARLK